VKPRSASTRQNGSAEKNKCWRAAGKIRRSRGGVETRDAAVGASETPNTIGQPYRQQLTGAEGCCCCYNSHLVHCGCGRGQLHRRQEQAHPARRTPSRIAARDNDTRTAARAWGDEAVDREACTKHQYNCEIPRDTPRTRRSADGPSHMRAPAIPGNRRSATDIAFADSCTTVEHERHPSEGCESR